MLDVVEQGYFAEEQNNGVLRKLVELSEILFIISFSRWYCLCN